MLQAPPPIIVDVIKQPPITPELGMGDVVLGAVGLTGAIMLAAVLVGLLVGGVFVLFKRMREGSRSSTDTGHARLRT